MIWRQRDLGVQDDRKRRQSAAVRRFETENSMDCTFQSRDIPSTCRTRSFGNNPRRCGGMFEWEHALSMMGDLKLSLT
jgi:hypothetical protein